MSGGGPAVSTGRGDERAANPAPKSQVGRVLRPKMAAAEDAKARRLARLKEVREAEAAAAKAQRARYEPQHYLAAAALVLGRPSAAMTYIVQCGADVDRTCTHERPAGATNV